MNAFLLPLLLIVPLVGAVVTALSGKGAKAVALLTSVLTLCIGGVAALQLDWNMAGEQLPAVMGRFEQIGFSLHVGTDALSLLLALTTSVLTTAAILASFPTVKNREGSFYGWLLVLLAALTGVWIARDLLLFYTFLS